MKSHYARGASAALCLILGLVAVSCSGTPSGSSAPRPRAIATLTADPSAAQSLVAKDATVVATRLHTLRPTGFSVAVHGHTIEVRGTEELPLPVADLIVTGLFQVRLALCGAGPYVAPTTGGASEPTPTSCSSSRYSLQAPNLTTDSQTGTSNQSAIPPDPALTSVAATSSAYDDSHPDSPVLVPQPGADVGAGGSGVARYLLGPTLLSGTAVAHTQATFVDPQWVVNVTLTPAGAKAWDDAARSYFHQLLAMDVDGLAVSVPLTQPAQSTFTSFAGRLQVSGAFTERTAEELAAELNSGPLVAPLSS